MDSTARVFKSERTVRVGDCNEVGDVRIDALARYLQDIGYDDTNHIGVGDGGNWVARSIEIDSVSAAGLPRRNDVIELSTYCGGVGRAFAQRNVVIKRGDVEAINSSTIWVHIDDSGKPVAVPKWLGEAYPDAKKISAKRILEVRTDAELDGDDGYRSKDFPLRASDFDINGHINNAVSFDALNEVADILGRKKFKSVLVEYYFPIEKTDKVKLLYKEISSGFEVLMLNDKNIASIMRWVDGQ